MLGATSNRTFIVLLDYAPPRSERALESPLTCRRRRIAPITDNKLAGIAPVVATYKLPISVLVVIHTADLQVLLLERADRPGFWQSVTGSQDAGETLRETARREVFEETGLATDSFDLVDWQRENRYEIYQRWRGRYAPGVTHNTEHVFGMRLPGIVPVTLAAREHLEVCAGCRGAMQRTRVFSWSNAAAIRDLPQRNNPA